MGPIFDALLKFFTEDDWNVTRLEGQPILSMGVSGRNGKWRCYAKSREEQQQFVFYSICSASAPPDKRHVIAEFLTRANFGMVIGNFEMDFNDGEIRYKTSIDVDGDDLSEPLIKNVVYTNVVMMDRYLPGILSVIDGKASPKDAIAVIENGS
jgi:hypothetical protein